MRKKALPPPPHPGQAISAALSEQSMTQAELARQTGLTTKHISQIVRGHAGIGTDAATAIATVLPVTARDLIVMQADFDLSNNRSRRGHR
jgi:HTH-type transcriptional regulator/antitoxin HigA